MLEKNNLSEEELEDIEKEIYDILEEYIQENIADYYKSDFLETVVSATTQWLEISAEKENWKLDDLPIEIEYYLQEVLESFAIPPREKKNENPNQKNISKLEKLEKLDTRSLGKQRTQEWYEIRQNCFSASNLWKILDSPAQLNSLIYEKCNREVNPKKTREISNIKSPLHWGIKYEAVSMQIYEHKHPGIRVKTDYGCILHEYYAFIGASPDGIVISGEKTGRMIEVKNIYNREITGIPLEEYWVQMQIQMETCDFLETRIQEYETEEAFYNDVLAEYKGVILFFLPKPTTTYLDMNEARNPSPFFEYMPLYISLEKTSIDKWIEEIQEKHQTTHILYDKSYWKLDEYSCIVVDRNPEWFHAILPKIEEAWKVVVKERENGFEHRAPKSRSKRINHTSDGSKKSEDIEKKKSEDIEKKKSEDIHIGIPPVIPTAINTIKVIKLTPSPDLDSQDPEPISISKLPNDSTLPIAY